VTCFGLGDLFLASGSAYETTVLTNRSFCIQWVTLPYLYLEMNCLDLMWLWQRSFRIVWTSTSYHDYYSIFIPAFVSYNPSHLVQHLC